MSRARWEVFHDREGYWRWRLVAANGEIVAASESYTRQADAERGVRSAQGVAVEASRSVTMIQGDEAT